MKTERELFQAYFKTVWKGIDLIQTIGEDFAFKLFDGKYVEDIVDDHWRTWQASASRECYKLVLVKPNQKQIDAGVYAVDLVSNDSIQVVNVYKAMIGAAP